MVVPREIVFEKVEGDVLGALPEKVEKVPLHVEEQIVLFRSEIERLKFELSSSQHLLQAKNQSLEETELQRLHLEDSLKAKEREVETLKKQNDRLMQGQDEYEK